MPRAVVLLSGGLDSVTTLALARSQGFDCFALSIDYGQRHRIELTLAAEAAHSLGAIEHRVVKLDLRAIGGSALTAAIDVPKGRDEAVMSSDIPVTYVPARNTILLGIALGWAEVLGSLDIFLGVNALDYSGYPDCRPEFIAAFESLAGLATKAGVNGDRFRIHAPLIAMSKADIIRTGTTLGVDYSRTLSCYDPDADGQACGDCDSCTLRRTGFIAANVPDPTRYSSPK
jgi:7-cyano-7-deazaguanine synthase